MKFNQAAFEENQRNKGHFKVQGSDRARSLIVDTENATYRGTKVKHLNSEGRRKFENLLLLNNIDKAGRNGLPKIDYR